MKIAKLMTKDLKTCRHTDMLDAAVGLMWDHDLGAVPVVDDAGALIGIVTDRDACMATYLQHQPPHAVPVTVAMNKHVVTCRPDDAHAAVARLMASHKIRRIPVVDDAQHPIGIVSLNDLARASQGGREITATDVAGTLASICAPRIAAARVAATAAAGSRPR